MSEPKPKRDKTIADATTSMSLGVACLFAGLYLCDFPKSYLWGGIFLAIGFFGVIYGRRLWDKIT